MPRDSMRVAIITGRRADYGIYLPLLHAIKADKTFDLDLLVTEMHYWSAYGETYKEIQTDGFTITPCWIPYSGMTNTIADLTHLLTIKFNKKKPDALIVLGDTGPMLAGAIVAAHLNIPVCHIQGGDLTGSIDNKLRYAITALSDWHFSSLPAHADRLKTLGIPADRIRVVGPLGIYAMKDAEFIGEPYLRTQLDLSDKPIILVIQHPVTDEAGQAGEQMRAILQAVAQFQDNYQPVIIYPNSDTGNEDMIKVIQGSPFKAFKSLPYLQFVSLLKISKVIVGNSSAGLVEAPLFGVPCVNIGSRQEGRIGGIFFRCGYTEDQIEYTLKFALVEKTIYRRAYSKNPYSSDIDGVAIILQTLKGISCG